MDNEALDGIWREEKEKRNTSKEKEKKNKEFPYKKKKPIRLGVVIILLIGIILLNINMYLLVKDKIDELDRDPLQRGAEAYDLNQCSCYLDEKSTLYFNQTNTWKVNQIQPRQQVDINFTELFGGE